MVLKSGFKLDAINKVCGKHKINRFYGIKSTLNIDEYPTGELKLWRVAVAKATLPWRSDDDIGLCQLGLVCLTAKNFLFIAIVFTLINHKSSVRLKKKGGIFCKKKQDSIENFCCLSFEGTSATL